MEHKLHKIAAGLYVYRNHRLGIEDFSGPEGGQRICWSVSGDLDGPDADHAHAELPQLQSLRAAQDWVDAFLDGADRKGRSHARVARENEPRIWRD